MSGFSSAPAALRRNPTYAVLSNYGTHRRRMSRPSASHDKGHALRGP